MVFGIIYKATNNVNGKVYIGQTTLKFNLRLNRHRHDARHKPKTLIGRAINKYGEHNFKWVTIDHCDSKEELNEMEFHYIKQYNSFKPNGYNMTLGGEGSLGLIPSMKTKIKMSKSSIGFKHSEEHKESMRGKNNYFYNNKLWLGKDGEHHHLSKKYIITFPDGNVYLIHGINKFCRDYINSDGKILYQRYLSMCANGKRKDYMGYRCRYFNKDTDFNIKKWGSS